MMLPNLPNVESPTFQLTIPSTKAKITMRPMKVKEEKILLMAKAGNDPGEILAAVKTVVQNCLVAQSIKEPPYNVDELAIFDIEFMFLRLRAASVSEQAEVSYIDNDDVEIEMAGVEPSSNDYERKLRAAQAKATRTFKIELNKVEVKFPEKTESQIKVNNKVGIHLRYPPASLYSDKEFLNATGEDLVEMLVEKSIDTIYEGEKISYDKAHLAPPGELKAFIENLDVKIYNKLKEFFTTLPHLEHKITYSNHSGKEREIVLTTLGDFFQL
jgi:hypothetical protein